MSVSETLEALESQARIKTVFFNFPSIDTSIFSTDFAYQMLLILYDIKFLMLCFWKRILNNEFVLDTYMSRNNNVRIWQLFLYIKLFKHRNEDLVLFFHLFTLLIATTANFIFTKVSDLYTLFFCYYFFPSEYNISDILSLLKLLGIL